MKHPPFARPCGRLNKIGWNVPVAQIYNFSCPREYDRGMFFCQKGRPACRPFLSARHLIQRFNLDDLGGMIVANPQHRKLAAVVDENATDIGGMRQKIFGNLV